MIFFWKHHVKQKRRQGEAIKNSDAMGSHFCIPSRSAFSATHALVRPINENQSPSIVLHRTIELTSGRGRVSESQVVSRAFVLPSWLLA